MKELGVLILDKEDWLLPESGCGNGSGSGDKKVDRLLIHSRCWGNGNEGNGIPNVGGSICFYGNGWGAGWEIDIP